ncbi:neutral/alkaline non-lysosomal ceramidase N-terminal domain-containing protein [Candidatus Poribacteria bacterium]|nr:neutral/alkaline non-lysosomal ceramidase N-terminal domain-containing protein [Candidatus Poribacteria bacterium]
MFLAIILTILIGYSLFIGVAHADGGFANVGVAQVDITPDYPIRLSGYGGRRTESEGVTQRIWAKALAIDDAVLVTVENCGLPDELTEEVATRLKKKSGIPREQFVIGFSHTHSAPCLTNAAPLIFSTDIPAEHQATIDRYTRQLADWLEEVALAALADRRLGELAWTEGEVHFAKNRRTEGGPVDRALPLLRVTDADGKLRAVWTSYACHCTTLGGNFNHICGDWAGYAQEAIQQDHPDVIALVTIGCGADANPYPRSEIEQAQQHGAEIAAEVNRLLEGEFTPISGGVTGRFERIALPFDTLPTLDEWKAKAEQGGPIGYHAQKQLERISRGETLRTTLSYPIQVWTFGNDLAVIFLTGEVVVDYSLRLKREFDRKRIWVDGYSNAFPCYIPSKRILQEGGYEGGGAMVYFDQPTRFAPGVEELIISAVHRLVPMDFIQGNDANELASL